MRKMSRLSGAALLHIWATHAERMNGHRAHSNRESTRVSGLGPVQHPETRHAVTALTAPADPIRPRKALKACSCDARPIYIVEPRWTGHRLWYVKLMTQEAPGRCVLITTAAARRSDEFRVHLAEADIRVRVVDRSRLSSRWYVEALWMAHEDGASIAVPDGEAALIPLLQVAPRLRASAHATRANLNLMRPYSHPGLRGSFLHCIKVILIGLLRLLWGTRLTVYALDGDGAARTLLHRLTAARTLHDPVGFAPAGNIESCRERLGVLPGLVVFSILGPLEPRKCVLETIEAWTRSECEGVLLLAGPAPREVVQAVEHARARTRYPILLYSRYLSDEELDGCVAATDVMLLLYRNPGSSGIMQKAMRADCGILTSMHTPTNFHSPGSRVRRISSLTPQGIACGLKEWGAERPSRTLTTGAAESAFAQQFLQGL
jgi:hypothetical protein